MPFDLSPLAQANAADCVLRHPKKNEVLRDKDSVASISALSPDSPLYKERQRARTDRAIEAAEKEGKTIKSASDFENMQTGMLADATSSLNFEIDGKPAGSSAEDFERFYDDPRFGWVRQQFDAWLGRRANFIPGLSGS